MRNFLRTLIIYSVAFMATGCHRSSLPSIVTADEGAGTLTRIYSDGSKQILLLPGAPHNVQVSANNSLVLATAMSMEHMHHDMAGPMSGMLVIVPAQSFNQESMRVVTLNGHLAHVIADSEGKTAYVTNSTDNAVLVIDIDSAKIIANIKVGAFPHGMRINPQRHELYTANVHDGTVSVVDLTTRKEVRRVFIGREPIQVAVTSNGEKLYVTLAKDSAVGIIDLGHYKKLDSLKVPNAPAQIYADPKGRYMYVADQGDKDHPGHTVSVIDVQSDRVVKTITTGSMPHGIVASADGRSVYITNMADGTVSQVDTSTFIPSHNYKVGTSPNGITIIE